MKYIGVVAFILAITCLYLAKEVDTHHNNNDKELGYYKDTLNDVRVVSRARYNYMMQLEKWVESNRKLSKLKETYHLNDTTLIE